MVSSKGKPTDPKLREEVKERSHTPCAPPESCYANAQLGRVKNETNKDGSGKGQATKLAKEYEKEGGGYENEAGSKNEPHKGAPEAKPETTKEKEVESGPQDGEGDNVEDKPKANSGKKASGKQDAAKAKTAKPKNEKKLPAEGTRRSARVSSKRSVPVEAEAEEDSEDETEVKRKAPTKKAKTTKK
ncbi:hypothetical protein MMC30_007974 [Trapelia coarctata]|nr:hypothetical protein [Trapelia coarctata]